MNSSPTTSIPRRRMLAALGLSASLPLCPERVFGEESAAPGVADRTSSIRISRVTPHICRDRVYVKVETNHGVSGWGEVKGVVPSVAAELIRAMFESFAVPHFLIHESYDDELLGRIVKPHWKKSADGQVSLPEGAGLCVDIDEAALATIANDPKYKSGKKTRPRRAPRHQPAGAIFSSIHEPAATRSE